MGLSYRMESYYPFGMVIPERRYDSSVYRFGFNGKENDNEVKGSSNQQDYGMRIYDPRLARFLRADPIMERYPFYSPYQFASNCPVLSIDVDGLEAANIVNKAEELVGTPYQFVGKKPDPRVIGLAKTPDGKSLWENTLRPVLQSISECHPYWNQKAGISDPEAEKEYYQLVENTRKIFSSLCQKGFDLGIDCSGFIRACYRSDQELLVDVNKMQDGSDNELAFFNQAAKEGKAYVHHNFDIISKGDFIYKPGEKVNHVMIFTGLVRMKNGKVVEFQTVEAMDTKNGVKYAWHNADSKKYTVGHPFRSTDTGSTIQGGHFGGGSWKLANPSQDPEKRTEDNVEQTEEIKKETKKK
jgi:RHS repeat-associated protein